MLLTEADLSGMLRAIGARRRLIVKVTELKSKAGQKQVSAVFLLRTELSPHEEWPGSSLLISVTSITYFVIIIIVSGEQRI